MGDSHGKVSYMREGKGQSEATESNVMVCAKNPKGASCMVRIYQFGMNFSTLKYSMLTSSEKKIIF